MSGNVSIELTSDYLHFDVVVSASGSCDYDSQTSFELKYRSIMSLRFENIPL